MLPLYPVPQLSPSLPADPPIMPSTLCNGCQSGPYVAPIGNGASPGISNPTLPAGQSANTFLAQASSGTASAATSTTGAAPCDACKRSMWGVALAVGAVVLVLALIARR